MGSELPDFPTDETTLGMLDTALSTEMGRTSVLDLCDLYSRLAGSDTDAVESEEDGIEIMRDVAYHPYDIIAALVKEVRRLRSIDGLR